jgi:hypothetical protein
VSDPKEQPNPSSGTCTAVGRRRAATRAKARSDQLRSRDACPKRQRLLDPDHEAFVDWFVTYWRRHGARLLAGQPTSKEA